jgi:hypothetical protein
LEPWFGEAILFAVICVVAFADFMFDTVGIFTEKIERIVTSVVVVVVVGLAFDVAFFTATVIAAVTVFTVFTGGLTFDVAFFTAGFFTAAVIATVIVTVIAVFTGLTFDVAFFTAAGFFFTAGTVLRAVG